MYEYWIYSFNNETLKESEGETESESETYYTLVIVFASLIALRVIYPIFVFHYETFNITSIQINIIQVTILVIWKEQLNTKAINLMLLLDNGEVFKVKTLTK